MSENVTSLIWAKKDDRKGFSSDNFLDDLKINTLIDINSLTNFNSKKLRLFDFLTLNEDTIKLRNELFFDLVRQRNLMPRFRELVGLLQDFAQLGINRVGGESVETNLYAVKEISMYTDIINGFHHLLQGVDIRSSALKSFASKIDSICNSEDFTRLLNETKKLDCNINKIKSITVGVNLNAQLQPVEAGIVGINNESYVSGNIIDKLLRAQFEKNEYTCIAPLESVAKGLNVSERTALSMAVNNGLNTVFSKSLTNWKDSIRRYTQMETSWLYTHIPEFNFIIGCVDFLLKLEDKGYPLCIPQFSQDEKIQDLYDPYLAINGEQVVKNSITFDKHGQIYILTGPNQGGKSVFTRAIGAVYSFLHLGILLPASSATVCPVDNVFTHFPSKTSDSYQKGRFATECSAISLINKNITAKSLFLFDESLSSTSNYEATEIAKEILTAYACIGCKGLFTTHLHDLCNVGDEINKRNDVKSRCTLLSAVLSLETHARTYKIIAGQGYGNSFASDIAKKYGLDHKTILSEFYGNMTENI